MFLIEKAHIDNLENHASAALEYKVFAYVTTKEQAEKFCAEAGHINRDESWVARMEDRPKPRFTWYAVPDLGTAILRDKREHDAWEERRKKASL